MSEPVRHVILVLTRSVLPATGGSQEHPGTGGTRCLSGLNASLIGPIWEKNGVFQRGSTDIPATDNDILVGPDDT